MADKTKKSFYQDEPQGFEHFDWLMRPLTDYLELQYLAFSGEGEFRVLRTTSWQAVALRTTLAPLSCLFTHYHTSHSLLTCNLVHSCQLISKLDNSAYS